MLKPSSKRKNKPANERDRRTALHYAAMENDLAKAQQLITEHTIINTQDVNSWSALHFAAQSNALAVAKLLLEAGADVHLTDEHGNTPLFTAVFNSKGDGELIALLRQ